MNENERFDDQLNHLRLVAAGLERAIASPVDVAIGVLMEREGSSRGQALKTLRALADSDGEDIGVAAQSVLESVGSVDRAPRD